MSSDHITWEDLDGDGQKELTTAVNGIWNRVTVCAETGKPLYNAQFGPGKRIPSRNIRDVAVTDLQGDGKKEILVALHTGLVVALNYKCEKVWSKRLPSPPNVLKCLKTDDGRAPWVVVGCDNGAVFVLNGDGEVIRQGQLNARAVTIDALHTPQGLAVVLASSKGEVKAFEVRGQQGELQ